MSIHNEIAWGLFGRRMFALFIDALIFISVFSILIRVFNLFIPGSDVREDPMQFYTEKDFNVFVATSIAALFLLTSYMLTCYRSKRGQTFGHLVAKIKIKSRDGKSFSFIGILRLLIISWIRLLIILAPGPFVAYYGGSITTSVFLLIWGTIIILPIPISKISRITLWEKLGGYKFESIN